MCFVGHECINCICFRCIFCSIWNDEAQTKLQEGIDEQVDHFYYLEDIFLLNIKPLSEALIDQLLSHFVIPLLIGSIGPDPKPPENDDQESLIDDVDDETSLEREHIHREREAAAYARISSKLALEVFSHRGFVNAVVAPLLHPYPPKLVREIVNTPPKYAVKTSTPVMYNLCRTSRRPSVHSVVAVGASASSSKIEGDDDERSDSENPYARPLDSGQLMKFLKRMLM